MRTCAVLDALWGTGDGGVGHAVTVTFFSMLAASTRLRSSWLSALELPVSMDLAGLFETADSRTARTASVHGELRAELVAALKAVKAAESGGGEIKCADNLVVHESLGVDLEAAQLALDTAKASLLRVSEDERERVVRSAQKAVVTRARASKKTANIRHGKRTFTVRLRRQDAPHVHVTTCQRTVPPTLDMCSCIWPVLVWSASPAACSGVCVLWDLLMVLLATPLFRFALAYTPSRRDALCL